MVEPPADAPAQDPEAALRARIASAAAGDRQEAGALLRDRLPRVRNLVRYLIRGDDLVDDIAQQVMIAILKGLPSYRGTGTWSAWCDRITARETFAFLKRHRGEAQKRADVAPEVRMRKAAATARGADDSYADRRDAIRLLESLPEGQREVLALHHIAGMSMPEVAETLGVPMETARSRARLAMRKLREQLAAELPTGVTP